MDVFHITLAGALLINHYVTVSLEKRKDDSSPSRFSLTEAADALIPESKSPNIPLRRAGSEQFQMETIALGYLSKQESLKTPEQKGVGGGRHSLTRKPRQECQEHHLTFCHRLRERPDLRRQDLGIRCHYRSCGALDVGRRGG